MDGSELTGAASDSSCKATHLTDWLTVTEEEESLTVPWNRSLK